MRIALLFIALLVVSCEPATAPRASPSTAPPNESPLPTMREGNARFVGHITDAKTGRPIEGVCVIIAVGRACQPNFVRTDANGRWFVDLPIGDPGMGGIDWDVIFEKDGYQSERVRIRSSPGQQTVDVQLKPV